MSFIEHDEYIEAVVDVANVLDDFSISAYLKDYDTPIIIEFEWQIPKQLNGRIELSGELKIDIVNS